MTPHGKVWASLDYACGKRVAAGMQDVLDALIRSGELPCEQHVVDMLRALSAATIDRTLAPDRAKTVLKGRAITKPGTLLKSQIQIRTGTEWDDARGTQQSAGARVRRAPRRRGAPALPAP